MAAIPLYPYEIPSLHALDHDMFPPHYSNLNFDRGIAAGSPINNDDLFHAKGIAGALKGHSEAGDPHVSRAMASKARYRTDAIAAAHATATCVPVGILGPLQAIQTQLGQMNVQFDGLDNRLGGIDNRLVGIDNRLVGVNARLHAIDVQQANSMSMLVDAANARIVLKNQATRVIDAYLPLYKSVQGSGLALALTICPEANLPLVAPAIVPDVGALPLNFNPVLSNYRHQHILDMIIFYNQSFDIAENDGIKRRLEKFTMFLKAY